VPGNADVNGYITSSILVVPLCMRLPGYSILQFR